MTTTTSFLPFSSQAVTPGRYVGDGRLLVLSLALEDDQLAAYRRLPEADKLLEQMDLREQLQTWQLSATRLQADSEPGQPFRLTGGGRDLVLEDDVHGFLDAQVVYDEIAASKGGPVLFLMGSDVAAAWFPPAPADEVIPAAAE